MFMISIFYCTETNLLLSLFLLFHPFNKQGVSCQVINNLNARKKNSAAIRIPRPLLLNVPQKIFSRLAQARRASESVLDSISARSSKESGCKMISYNFRIVCIRQSFIDSIM